MHVVSVLYPRSRADDRFDLEHYVSVHLKLGFRLMQKHFGVTPDKAIVLHSTRGLDDSVGSAPYLAICWVCFRSREDADLFAAVFGIDEAARALQADWANYCPVPPEVVVGEVLELSDSDVLVGSDRVLESHGIALTK